MKLLEEEDDLVINSINSFKLLLTSLISRFNFSTCLFYSLVKLSLV
jgi:hypothetical protein